MKHIKKEYNIYLDKLKYEMNITSLHPFIRNYEEIIKNPASYPMDTPIGYNERLEHLYDLTKMLFIDKNPTIDKTSMMDRIAVGLGFPVENVRLVVKEAIKFFLKEPDIEDFKNSIKKVNPINN